MAKLIDAVQESEILLGRFNKLIAELLRGSITRNTFRPWEVELLLDIETCEMRSGSKKETLRRYQKAVQRAIEKGAPGPFKLSEYLAMQKSRKQDPVELAPPLDAGAPSEFAEPAN